MQLRPSEAINLAGQPESWANRRELHQSQIALLLACPRKFDLSVNQQLDLIERPRALTLGSAFQKAIEEQSPEAGVRALRGEHVCAECGGATEVEEPENGELVTCGTCKGEGYVPDEGALLVNQMTESQMERLLVNEAIVASASKLYLKTWPGGIGETREFEFRVRLRNPVTGAYSRTFDLAGKADGLVDLYTLGFDPAFPDTTSIVPVPGGYELIENKLVGQITPQKVQLLPLDRQVAIYRYGIWRATGRKVETVRYRWMRKPQIRQKQNESLTEFCDRIRQDYEDRPDFYMAEEEPQFATTGDLLRIEAELWQLAEMVRASERGNIYVRNTASCSDYGGCSYIPICTGDPDAMNLYRRRENLPEPAEADAV